eukprot:4980620-Pleurochrysis_carterae.AAC.1
MLRPTYLYSDQCVAEQAAQSCCEQGSELARGGDHTSGRARPGEDSLTPLALQRLGQTARHSLRTPLATTLYM